MDDSISRRWLMECVNEGWIKFETEKDENRFMHLVRDIAPSAQPGWIPLAVKYPETNEDVLLQFPSNQGVGFYENGSWGINTGDGIYSAIGDGEEMPMAWMPLPTPYREGGQDD